MNKKLHETLSVVVCVTGLLIAGLGHAQSSSSSTSTSSGSTSSSSSSSGGAASTSSSSTSSSSSSSSGGVEATVSHGATVCPQVSDGEVVSIDPETDDIDFNPDDYAGSIVVFRDFMIQGGPSVGSASRIVYANGSQFNRPMQLVEGDEVIIEQIDFPPTGGWDVWETLTIPDMVLNGQYDLVSLAEEGGPNLRRIGSTIYITGCQSGAGCGYGYGDGSCPTDEEPPQTALSCSIGTPNVWNNGYVLSNITITNEGDTPVSGWSADLVFPEPPQMLYNWNAAMSVSGNTITADNLQWNETIQPGQSVSFGLMGSHDGSFDAPACTVFE